MGLLERGIQLQLVPDIRRILQRSAPCAEVQEVMRGGGTLNKEVNVR